MEVFISAHQSNSTITKLKAKAKTLGFEAFGIVRYDEATKAALSKAGAALEAWLRDNRHGTMDFMAQKQERRQDPSLMMQALKSIIMVGMNYGPDSDPRATLTLAHKATLSVYARNKDYHDLIKGRLKELAHYGLKLARQAGDETADVKVFVDTAPVMEKPLAQLAGLGWQGRHTNLVSRDFGSWLFLGAIFTTLDLPASPAEDDHCGSCRACLDACPTNAFPAPYQLDARRCISYLTIEHKGSIALEFRRAIGNRIYGCDDCLAACPWNKFAQVASEIKLQARDDLRAPALADLLALNDADFRAKFAGSPVKRIGHARFMRNVLIACGNSGDKNLRTAIAGYLSHDDDAVRESAAWALSELER